MFTGHFAFCSYKDNHETYGAVSNATTDLLYGFATNSDNANGCAIFIPAFNGPCNYNWIVTIVTHEILHLFGGEHHEDSGYTDTFCLYHSTSRDEIDLCINCTRGITDTKFETLYPHNP